MMRPGDLGPVSQVVIDALIAWRVVPLLVKLQSSVS